MTALTDLAQREYRAPKAQAALIIRQELERLGIVKAMPSMGQATGDQKSASDPGKAS